MLAPREPSSILIRNKNDEGQNSEMGKRGPATNCLLEQEGRGALVDVFTPSQCEEVWQQKELI